VRGSHDIYDMVCGLAPCKGADSTDIDEEARSEAEEAACEQEQCYVVSFSSCSF